jgi:hypothetical protein
VKHLAPQRSQQILWDYESRLLFQQPAWEDNLRAHTRVRNLANRSKSRLAMTYTEVRVQRVAYTLLKFRCQWLCMRAMNSRGLVRRFVKRLKTAAEALHLTEMRNFVNNDQAMI